MKQSLAGKVALITGASSGIGWAAALEFSRLGARVALAARRKDRLDLLAARIDAAGGQALAIACDVADLKQAAAAVETTLKRWSRVDLLVNNAGLMATTRFHAQDPAQIEAVMRTNYLGAAALIQAALPAMLRQKEGHVVNVASVAGIIGLPYMASYCASKFALVGLTEALRREYYGTGVTFTAFCPGTVQTPMAEESLKDKRIAWITRPKSAEQAARQIALCCLRRAPELIYGEAPGWLLKLAKLAPAALDWAAHHVIKRVHPLARGSGPY